MIQRPSQEEIEKGLAEFKGDYKRLLRNITNCLEFDYKAICSLRTLLADSKEDIIEVKRTIRPYVVDLIYFLILDEKDLNNDEPWEDEELSLIHILYVLLALRTSFKLALYGLASVSYTHLLRA